MNNRLILLRKKIGLTQAQLAAILKISRPYLTEIEKGTRKPSPDFFLALLSTNVSLDWLFSGKGDMFRSSDSSDPFLSDLISVFKQLPDNRKKLVLDYAIDQKTVADLAKKEGRIPEKGGLDS